MKYYIDSALNELLALASDGSEDSFITDGFELADDDQVAAFRAAQAAANAPTPAEVLAAANAQRDSLLASAGLRVAPLQDAVDLGSASAVDTASLKSWKEYRIAVNGVSAQAGFPTTIDWPAPPS
ncbi:tail fiber assembly protein [Pseudomonas gingeri]|uniref:Tail fiber assembly protein n=1 Tax=Pseudomonas gingeri TaxID=117681 RepID=A0A7Y7YJ33_9PSED|nr:tail fiber assembly protein [Pseudomonas gingeri]NWB30873.1 tail fiber assembly protein [Pseudomonas gingeri]NWC37213.1 tail fiber assembly protein [Pseudomonas gingeri]